MGVRYEIDFDNIEKTVDCKKLNEKIQNLTVFLKLNDILTKLNEKRLRNQILQWAWCLSNDGDMDGYDGNLSDLSEETVVAIEQQVDGIVKGVEEVLFDFKTKTDIKVYWEFNYDEERVIFELNWDDIVQFTPKANRLHNMGVDFDIMTYDDN